MEGKWTRFPSVFPITNMASLYMHCYFKLLIAFCAIFDPLTQVKGEISSEGVLRALSFHLWLKPNLKPLHHNLAVESSYEISCHRMIWFLVNRPSFLSREAGIMLAGYVDWILAPMFFLPVSFWANSVLISDIFYSVFSSYYKV